MKKAIALTCLLWAVCTVTFAAEPGFTQSVEGWTMQGNFIYDLYDSAQHSQKLSQVNAPQNQNMSIATVIYTVPDGSKFLRLNVGLTPSQVKGTGYDADWAALGSSALTDYGNVDFYGRQRLFNLDYGWNTGSTAWFVGWERRDSANCLQNVVYHLVSGSDVGNQTQADTGSILNGSEQGFHLGLENTIPIGRRLDLHTSLALGLISETAHGEWYNHSPGWIWNDSGTPTLSQTLTMTLDYHFSKQSSAFLGYSYFQAKATGLDETINQGSRNQALAGAVDLTYRQQGLIMGINAVF
ncbi:MAG: hypothetical protein P4N41_16650 [Negativicutes bacterium]|nr:hypothetical protein [Negativicutes bacterium]